MDLIQTLGGEGKGPGEVNGAGHLYVTNDTLFLLNDRKRSVELFDNSTYSTTINLQLTGRFDPSSRFFAKKNRIYMANSTGSNSLSMINFKTDSIFNFGRVHEYSSQAATRIKNQKHVLAYKATTIRFILFIVMAGFSTSCSKEPMNPQLLEAGAKVTQLSDSSYISKVQALSIYDDHVYFNDRENNRMVVLNSDLEMVRSFGQKGRGPGEFNQPGTFVIANDSVFVNDQQRIKIFDIRGRLLTSAPAQASENQRFAKVGNKFFFSKGIIRPDLTATRYASGEFSDVALKHTPKSRRGRSPLNMYSNLSWNDRILSLKKNAPFIDLYATSGERLQRLDLRTIKPLKSYLQNLWHLYQQNLNDKNQSLTWKTLFFDFYIHDDRVYVLCATFPPARGNNNYIIVLTIQDDNLQFDRLLQLKDKTPLINLFSSLAIDDKNIYAFGSDHSITKFSRSASAME